MDTFFTKTNCDRCSCGLSVRTQSWFNEHEAICMECSNEEQQLKVKLRESHGRDFEGCGHHISQLRLMAKRS